MPAPRRVNDRWRGFPDELAGRLCYGGIDLSNTTDLTAVVWYFPPEDDESLHRVVPRFFVPELRMAERVRRDRVPYDLWVRQGALMTTPGNVVDYDFVKQQIFADAQHFQVGTIGIDPFNATQIALQLGAEGLTVEFFRQGFLSMNLPTKELERLVLDRLLDHGGQPVLEWCGHNVTVQKDAAGNLKPAKDKSHERIDGIVALVIAIGMSLVHPDGGPSVYEERGLADADVG